MMSIEVEKKVSSLLASRFALLEEVVVMRCKLQELKDPGSHLYIPTVN